MPKKTAYSRSGAPRSKAKQKSFELVRPASDDRELDAPAESIEEESSAEEVVEITSSSVSAEEEEEEEALEKVSEVKARSGKSAAGKAATAVSVAPAPTGTSTSTAPKSAAARLAERKQAQKQRASASLISVEHYNYVRRDLIFILILAIIMFGVIIALHFVLGS